jgi:hypothetical protein
MNDIANGAFEGKTIISRLSIISIKMGYYDISRFHFQLSGAVSAGKLYGPVGLGGFDDFHTGSYFRLGSSYLLYL